MSANALLLKFMLTYFKFGLEISAISQYGHKYGTFILNMISYNVTTSAFTLK